MLDVFRRNERIAEAELHEKELVDTLKKLYIRALRTFTTVESRSDPIKFDWILQFEMTDSVDIPVTDNEYIAVRIGKEKTGWVQRLTHWKDNPNVIIECRNSLHTDPTRTNRERYILVSEGAIFDMSEWHEDEVPYVQLTNRVKLVKEALDSLEHSPSVHRKE